MRTFLRSKVTLLFMALGLLIAIPAVALADTIVTDPVVNTVVVDNNVSKAPGETGSAKVWLLNDDNATDPVNGCNASTDDPVSITLSSNNSDVTFDSSGTKANPASLTNCGAAAGKEIGYTVSSSAAGPFPKTVTVTASGSGGRTTTTGGPNPTTNIPAYTPDTFTITITAPPNTAPTVPGVPSGTSPNQGTFALNWTASTDAESNPITYTLQHKNSAASAAFSDVATGISGNSYQFGDGPDANTDPDNPVEDEGTWTYRVKASDGSLSSAFSADSSAIKVDKTRPNAPLANEGTPDYTASNGDKWFKNSATVSFTANGDPNLADGSLGSGVASVSANQSRSTTGALSYSGTATDNVGLVSLATTGTVYVDATNPVAQITCPSTSAILGSTASANWTASDVGSDLATAASGSVPLNTSAIAASLTATAPTATDNVGLQSASATCNYSVAADFLKFLQPIDGNMVNAGKVGRVYPVKWQLTNNTGALISDAQGLALAQQMSVQQKGVPCVADQQDSLETEVAAGSTTIRYDEASDQFIFNYKAPATKGCYDLNIFKADGVNTQTVKFTFTK